MTVEAAQPNAEVATQVDLAFMDVEAMEQLRAQQEEQLFNAGRDAVQAAPLFEGAAARDVARQEVNDKNEENCQAYVAQHMQREANPELFDTLTKLVTDVSVHNMSSEKWYLGERDEDGNFTKPETSGRNLLRQAIDTLRGKESDNEPSVPPETPPAAAEIVAAQAQLESARQKLAELSIQKRQLIAPNRNRHKQLHKDFEAAQKTYNDAVAHRYGMEIAQKRQSGVAEADLKTHAVAKAVEEHKNFTQAEATVLDSDHSRRGAIAKWLAKSNRRFFASMVGAGFVTGFALEKAGWVVSAAAGPAGITAALAVRTTSVALKSLIGLRVQQITEHGKRSNIDNDELKLTVEGLTLADTTVANFAKGVSDALHSTIGKRVEKDVTNNRTRIVKAMGAGIVGGVIGYELAEHAGFGPWGHHSSTTSHNHGSTTGTKGGGTATAQHPHDGGKGTGTHTKTTHHQSGHTDGFKDNVDVQPGHGYTQELQDLAAQKGIHLNGAQAWEAYQHVNGHVHGDFFTNDHSYVISHGNLGISRPGAAQWNPAAVHAFHHWMESNLSKNNKLKLAA